MKISCRILSTETVNTDGSFVDESNVMQKLTSFMNKDEFANFYWGEDSIG